MIPRRARKNVDEIIIKKQEEQELNNRMLNNSSSTSSSEDVDEELLFKMWAKGMVMYPDSMSKSVLESNRKQFLKWKKISTVC